jgi:serine/threonine-protein kinase RsbW
MHNGAPPAALASVVDTTYPAAAASVGVARRSVARWLEQRAVDEMLVGDVALAISEACTNVVLHGYPTGPVGSFRVVAESTNGSVRVTVSDDGHGMVPRPDSPGIGLGLPLMHAVTDELEVRPARIGSGTVVSMVFSADESRARAERPV